MKTKNDKTEIVTSSAQIPEGYVSTSGYSTKDKSTIFRRRCDGEIRAVKVVATVADFAHGPVFVHEGDVQKALRTVRPWGKSKEKPSPLVTDEIRIAAPSVSHEHLLLRIAEALEKLAANNLKDDPRQTTFPFAANS